MFWEVNYLAVVAAAVAHFIVGAFWYGLLFAKQWMASLEVTEERMEKIRQGGPGVFVISFIGSLFLAWSVAVLFKFIKPGMIDGILFGILFWFGFSVYNGLNNLLYQKEPFNRFLIDLAYHLVGIVAVCEVIAFL